MNQLKHYEAAFPESLLTVTVDKLDRVLDGPTLFHFPGKIKSPPFFISTCLHGNEHSSFFIAQSLMNQFGQKQWPIETYLLIGNPQAMSKNVRQVPGEDDFNRIWGIKEAPEHWSNQLLSIIKNVHPALCLDIHNNSGKNPAYACVNVLNKDYIKLAALFSDIVVYYTKPDGTLSIAMSDTCPSLTVEAGISADPEGLAKTLLFLDKLYADPKLLAPIDQTNLLHTKAIIRIQGNPSIDLLSTENSKAQIKLRADIESLNFRYTKGGETLLHCCDQKFVDVIDDVGKGCFDEYFYFEGPALKLKDELIFSMLTTKEDVIHSDCLGYIMKNIPTAIL